MDTFERNGARALAIAYNAYLEASLGDKLGQLAWWASMLLRAQRDTGIELIPVDRLLYPLTGDAMATRATVALHRDTVEGAAPTPPPGAELAEIIKASGVFPRDDDGGALVPAPKPQPRKPSPGASVASPAASAAAFFAGRA